MEHNEAASAGDWVRFVARVRFGTQVVGGKKISATSIKAVADRLAWYANADGSRGRPGVARLAVDLETTQTTVKNAIAVLRRVGLLRLVKAGGRHGADVYQLIIGADIIEHPDITVWTLGQHTLAVKRQSDKYAGRWTTPEPQTPQGSEIEPEPQTPQGSAIGQESQTPQGSEKGPIATPIADPTGGGKTSNRRPLRESTADPTGVRHRTLPSK